MIYKVIIGLLIVSTVIYYIFCFLEVFDFIKFTGKNTKVKVPKMFIPFYYLIKSDEPDKEETVEQHTPVKKKRKPIKIKNIEK